MLEESQLVEVTPDVEQEDVVETTSSIEQIDVVGVDVTGVWVS